MKQFFMAFQESAKEFKNLRSLIMAALLVALHTVFASFLSIMVTDSLRISISFIVNVVIGCMFGPVMGFVCGGLGDIVQFLIKPTGPYFPGWTLSAALAGLIYGMFFYHKVPARSKEENKIQTGNEATVDLQTAQQLQVHSSAWKTTRFVLLSTLPVIALIVWFTAPFLTITDKSSGSILEDGSGFGIIKQYALGSGTHNAAIVAVLMGVLCVVVLILTLLRKHVLSLVFLVAVNFAAMLAVYTDKKTTGADWGFWLMVILLVLDMIGQLLYLAREHQLDVSFLLRCTIVLLVDTLIINVVIGTYWLSVMYGKGFTFYLISRLVKNLIQLPINIILTYYVLGFVREIKSHLK